MKEKAGTEESMKDKENPMAELNEQALKNWEQALKASLKWQQDAGKWWNQWAGQPATAPEWQKCFTNWAALATDTIPAAQKRTDELLDLVEKNARTGLDLMKKAADAAQAPGIAESQAKWTDWWTASLDATRANAEAVVQIQSRAIDCCAEFMRKTQELGQVRPAKVV